VWSGDKVSRCRRGEVDPLTLDGILNETSRLSERSEMYFRFLKRRLQTGKYQTILDYTRHTISDLYSIKRRRGNI